MTVETDRLTKRQREIYEFIRTASEERGYPPTVREIGDAFDIKSPNGVMCHLNALIKKRPNAVMVQPAGTIIVSAAIHHTAACHCGNMPGNASSQMRRNAANAAALTAAAMNAVTGVGAPA